MDEGISKTSMLYWYPRVQGLGIPLPRTEIVEVPFNHLISVLDGKRLPKRYVTKIIEASAKIGYPLFLRTDMGSAKHSWERTCYVPEGKSLFKHIWALIDETLAAGMFGELDPNALVFREMLQLNSFFTAFSGLPISCERRYFIKDGKVACHHPYWIQDAIERSWKQPSEPDWKERLFTLNKEGKEEITLLSEYATKVSEVLDGYWSVDFAEVKGGGLNWRLIDMAEGEKSWHPDCDKKSV